MRTSTTLAAFIASTGAALAHTGHVTQAGAGWAYGFMHPLGGVDHILAMLAVGLLAYLVYERAGRREALWLVPAAFVGTMAIGGAFGAYGFGLPFVELAIGLSIVVIGGAAALGRNLSVAAAMALVGFFALFHGLAHGVEMPLNASGTGYGLGFVAATALLHGAGIAAGFGIARLSRPAGIMTARAGGAAIAVFGIAIVGGAI